MEHQVGCLGNWTTLEMTWLPAPSSFILWHCLSHSPLSWAPSFEGPWTTDLYLYHIESWGLQESTAEI